MICKTLQRRLKIEQHETHQQLGWIMMLHMIATATFLCEAGILYLKTINIQWIHSSKLVLPLCYIHEIVICLTGDIHFIVQIGKLIETKIMSSTKHNCSKSTRYINQLSKMNKSAIQMLNVLPRLAVSKVGIIYNYEHPSLICLSICIRAQTDKLFNHRQYKSIYSTHIRLSL